MPIWTRFVADRHARTAKFPAGVDEEGKPLFSMGSVGILISLLAVVGITVVVGAGYFGSRQLHTKIDLVHVPHTAALERVLDAAAV